MVSTMVVFWAAIAALVVVLVRRTGPMETARRETPEETLRHRLARGEIDVEEYNQRLDALRPKR